MTASVSVAPTVAKTYLQFRCRSIVCYRCAGNRCICVVYIVLQLADLVLNLNLPWPLFGR